MLVKFSVKNYKQFKEEIVFDLSAGNYSFNEECVKDGVVKTALIYGANGTGKSSIGWAMFDLAEHLTNNSSKGIPKNYYANALALNESIEFTYSFYLLNSEVIYSYTKDKNHKILSEKLTIDSIEIINYELGKPFKIVLEGTEHLNRELNAVQNLSVLTYVYNNSNLSDTKNSNVFIELMKFVESMVWSQTVSSGMQYVGLENSVGVLTDIIESGFLEGFEQFLNENGVECKLAIMEYNGYNTIAFKFDSYLIPFIEIASTGTKHLSVLYLLWIETQKRNVSLLFIDEFDSAYHFNLSVNIVEKLKQLPNTQVILTTHNTALLDNDLIRPDCGFVIDGKEIKALQHCTKKELRMAHNLEKMYRAGGFDG